MSKAEQDLLNLNRRKIIQQMEQLLLDKARMTPDEILNKYEEFEKECPKIYLSIMDGKFNFYNLQELKQYNQSYERVYNKAKGKHLQRRMRADMAVGEQIAEKHFYPNLDKKPSEADYQNALKQVEEKYRDAENNEEPKRKLTRRKKIEFTNVN
jgi:hypothetical protein